MVRQNIAVKWFLWAISAIASLAIGELFLSGTFLGGVLLGTVPESVHTLVGWILIIGAIVGAITNIPRRR